MWCHPYAELANMSGGLGYPSAWSRHDVEQRIIQNEAMTEFYENKVSLGVEGCE